MANYPKLPAPSNYTIGQWQDQLELNFRQHVKDGNYNATVQVMQQMQQIQRMYPGHSQINNGLHKVWSPLWLLRARLRLPMPQPGDIMEWPGIKHMDAAIVGGYIHLFIVANDDKGMVLSEEGDIFPSDAFIAKMKLLMEAQR